MQPPTAIIRQPKNRIAIERTRYWLLAVPGVLLLAAHLLPAPQNGSLAGLPALCPLKTLSGWPCPGCGLTRSLVSCAHGDWAGAFAFHPLGAIFYFGLWGALALGVLQALQRNRANSQNWVPQRAILFLSGAYAAAMILVWLIRLTGIVPYPPHF